MTHRTTATALITLLALCGAGSLAAGTVEAAAAPRAGRSSSMPSRPQPARRTYEPDQASCRAETIETAYRSHLRPWADQPEEVQQRLRRLQGEMTRRTLSRCIDKGLMSREEATAVERRLDLPASPQAAVPSGPDDPHAEVRP